MASKKVFKGKTEAMACNFKDILDDEVFPDVLGLVLNGLGSSINF